MAVPRFLGSSGSSGKVLMVVALLALSAASCGFLKKSKPSTFAVETIPPSSGVVAIAGAPIAIDVVELPPGADRLEIVVRKEDQQLDVRASHLWPASLESVVLHTLAFDLAARLPEGMVILPGQIAPGGPKRGIDVTVGEIGAGLGNVVVIDARWTLRTNGAPDVTRHERVSIDVPSLDSDDIAVGMSHAIAQFADRVVATLR